MAFQNKKLPINNMAENKYGLFNEHIGMSF